MFNKKPDKTKLIDELDVQIEEHRLIGNSLDKEYSTSRQETESLAKKGLMRAAKIAHQGYIEVKKLFEDNEISRIQLRRTRTRLISMPGRLPQKTIEGVSKILQDSQKQVLKYHDQIGRIIEEGTIYDDTKEDIISPSVESEAGFENFLEEIGLGGGDSDEAVSKRKPQEIEYSLPEIPQGTPTITTKLDKEGKEKLEEDNI